MYSYLHVEGVRRLTQITGRFLSSAFGKMELPITKMEETWKGTDLGGQNQLNLASLSLRQRND